jgi:hypothetical protein
MPLDKARKKRQNMNKQDHWMGDFFALKKIIFIFYFEKEKIIEKSFEMKIFCVFFFFLP